MNDKRLYTLLALTGLASLPLLLGSKSAVAPASDDLQAAIKRGEYLVQFGGCVDCHTPQRMGPHGPEPDTTRFMAGHPEELKLSDPPPSPGEPWTVMSAGLTAWSGPWGISFGANLTPDDNTGMGIWTEEMFRDAMRTGRHFGVSRPILPPMPWRSVGSLSDEDLRAIYLYLRSLPPIKNRVPDPIPLSGQSLE